MGRTTEDRVQPTTPDEDLSASLERPDSPESCSSRPSGRLASLGKDKDDTHGCSLNLSTIYGYGWNGRSWLDTPGHGTMRMRHDEACTVAGQAQTPIHFARSNIKESMASVFPTLTIKGQDNTMPPVRIGSSGSMSTRTGPRQPSDTWGQAYKAVGQAQGTSRTLGRCRYRLDGTLQQRDLPCGRRSRRQESFVLSSALPSNFILSLWGPRTLVRSLPFLDYKRRGATHHLTWVHAHSHHTHIHRDLGS